MSTNCKTEVSLTLEVAKKWDGFFPSLIII